MDKAKLLLEKGLQLMAEGDWARASETLREVLDGLEEGGGGREDRALLSQVLRRKAHADSRLSELDLATNELEQALEISTELKDLPGIADAYRGLGYVRLLEGSADEAMELYSKAQEVASRTKDDDLLGRILLETGNVHFYKYDFEKAKEFYGKALAVLKAVGNDAELTRVYNNLGDAHRSTGDLEEGIEFFRRCMDISTKVGNVAMQGFAALNAAECFIQMKELKFAREYLSKATRSLTKANDRIGLANVWRTYGLLYLAEGKHEAAEKAINKCIAIARATDFPNLEAEGLMKLACVHIAAGRKDQARTALNAAIGIFERTSRTKEIEQARKLLAKL